MNQLTSRSNLISNKYKLNNYDEVKNYLEKIYKIQASEFLVEYLIRNNKDIDQLSRAEKKKIFCNFLESKNVKDLQVIEEDGSIAFSFLTSLKEPTISIDDIKIVVILDDRT